MINKIFGSQFLWFAIILGFFAGCEEEDNLVGYDIIGDNAANFETAYVDLLAETMGADTIRSDRKVQYNAVIGAFNDPVFGSSKAAYYSQVRLGKLNPTFGEDALVDSVVLSIPVFAITSDTVSYNRSLYKTTYNVTTDNGTCTIKDTLRQYLKATTFKMDSIYGHRDAQMTLRVQKVTESMGTIDSAFYSNRDFNTGELFGSKVIDDKVLFNTIVQYTSSINTDSTVVSQDASPNIKINLEGMRSFVQDQIVNAQGSANLSDQISFITNVLKGIKIDVAENDGFIFNVSPSNFTLKAYVSSKNPDFVDANGNGIHDAEENCAVNTVMPRRTEILDFIVGSSISTTSNKFYNASQNSVENTNGTILNNPTDPSVNYLKGMGGSAVRLVLDPNQIEEIRDNVANHNWVINEAHIKVYPETSVQGNLPLPNYLYLYNYTQQSVLPDYASFLPTEDLSNIQGFPYAQIALPYDNDKGYYLLRCTEFIKNIVEKNEPIDDLMLELGSFTGYNPNEIFFAPESPFNSDRIYNPYRLAIVGTNPMADASKKLQLEIYYGVKN